MNPTAIRVLRASVLALFLLVALAVFTSRSQLDMYGRYLRETSPAVTLRLNQLSAQMDETTLQRHFDGVPMRCTAQAPGADQLGERVCYSAIDSADGQAALLMAAFFSGGQLKRVTVQLPWWVHGHWVTQFNGSWGKPIQAGRVSLLGGPVLRWTLPNGYVEFNARRELNPLGLNVIVWTGRS